MIPNIHLNETSPVIAVLHKMMELLNLQVDAKERLEQRAGKNTQESIRTFQEENKLPIDDNYVVDTPTINFMLARLGELGYLDSKLKRTISGKVQMASGQGLNRVPLGAIDLALPGVSQYKKWASTEDLKNAQDMIEFLGLTESNQDGFYEITFYDWMYEKSERRSADVVVFALSNEDGRTGNQILGRSALFQNVGYHTTGVDIIIEDAVKGQGEYQTLFQRLNTFVNDNKISFDNVKQSEDYISFIAKALDIPLRKMQDLLHAHSLEEDSKIDAPFWYVVLGIPFYKAVNTDSHEEQSQRIKESLGQLREKEVRKALSKAFATHKIETISEADVENWLQLFETYVADLAVVGEDSFTKKALTEVGITDKPKQVKFAKLLNKYKTFSPELAEELRKDRAFNVAEVNDLQTSYALSGYTDGDFEMVNAIKKEFNLKDTTNLPLLAKNSEKEWTALVKKSKIPHPFQMPSTVKIPKNLEGAFDTTYGKSLHKQFAASFPTMAFSGELERAITGSNTSGLKNPSKIKKVIDDNPGFEFLNTPIEELAKRDDTLKNDASLKTEFKAIQRVFKLAPDFDTTNTLLKDKLHSAHSIYRMGESEFVKKYENLPGLDTNKAKATWRRAEATHAATVSLVAELKAMENASAVAALRTGDEVMSDFPNWKNLFQGGDICECKHCRSVYSPAAYFADLLTFLKNRKFNDTSAKAVIFERRPDLGYLELNCENANVTLPYIDVVNEVLEDVVAAGDNDKELTGLTTINGSDLDQAKTDIVAILQTQDLTIGENIHLASIGSMDRWVMHSDSITYLLKKKGGVNYFAEILRNTKAKADELRANPQYTNAPAYHKLKEATFPFALPFDLFEEEVRASFKKIQISRWDLMQKFKGTTTTNDASEGEIAAVYFGISVDTGATMDEKRIILDQVPASRVYEFWGGASFPALGSNANLQNTIKNVSTFLSVTGLQYNQVLTLLDLKFINPNGAIHINHLDATCDSDQKEITPLDFSALDRINRFLRLWKKLGWKMWEVDLVINHQHIGKPNDSDETGILNEAFLIKLMYLIELKNKLGKRVSIEQVCSLFGNLNTTTRFTELHEKREVALYQKLFLNKKLINPLDKAFETAEVNASSNSEKIAAHKSVVQAALKIKETDLDIYLNLTKPDNDPYIPDGTEGDLILSHLSFLYRHVLLANSLKVKAADWKTFLKIYNADVPVFTDPKSACELVDIVKTIQSSGFNMDELNYVLTADLTAKSSMPEATVGRFLLNLRDNIQAVTNQFDPSQYFFLEPTLLPTEIESLEKLLMDLLLKNNYTETSTNRILSILGDAIYTAVPVPNIPDGFVFPTEITDRIDIRYVEDEGDDTNSKLLIKGSITEDRRNDLLGHVSLAAVTANPDYRAAIQHLFEITQSNLWHLKLYKPTFSVALENTTLDFESNLPKETAAKLFFNSAEKLLELNGILSAAERELLVELDNLDPNPAYVTAIGELYAQQSDGVFHPNALWIVSDELDFEDAEFYAKHLELAIRRLLAYFTETETENIIIQLVSGQLGVTESIIKRLINHYRPIDSETVFEHFKNTLGKSFGVVDNDQFKDTFDIFYWLHRIGICINKWALDLNELQWLIDNHEPTRTFDFGTLLLDDENPMASLEHFLRTGKLLELNAQLHEEEISALRSIEKLHNGDYASATDFADDVATLTKWNSTDIEHWINSVDLTYPDHYLIVENWLRLVDSMKLLEKLNGGTATALSYANASMGKDESNQLKQLLRSKYGPETWLTISTEIQDVLRERKRDALAAYVLVQPKPEDAPSGKWENTNDLYAYYLLDIEMSSCMLTSRLVQGSGSVQLFVQRCFMGLEPEVRVKSDGDGGDSAWRWWKWMRKYRVWEANRKVFLYPENWLEPELRPDKSSFFRDLENELLQNEVNQLNVEQAYLNYLDKLNDVARLDIAAFYHEDDADQTIMHVFGRTANADPHIYYYRQYDYRRWTPWEKIEMDIVGDHLIPIVVNKRLFLYWPEFKEEPDEEANSLVPIPEQGDENSRLPPTYKKAKLRLTGSEYRNKNWKPKKISKEFHESGSYIGQFETASFKFYPIDLSANGGKVGIQFSGDYTNSTIQEIVEESGSRIVRNTVESTFSGAFELFGCDGVPVKSSTSIGGHFSHLVKPDDSELQYLDYNENNENNTFDNLSDDDFSLQNFSFLNSKSDKLSIPILRNTPGLFQTYFAWHLSYMDKLLKGLDAIPILRESIDSMPIGSWLPFVYSDREKTFIAFPMLDLSPKIELDPTRGGVATRSTNSVDAAMMNGKTMVYYPDIKSHIRGGLLQFEGQARSAFDSFDWSSLTQAELNQLADSISRLFQKSIESPVTIDNLKELIIKIFLEIGKGLAGMNSLMLFNEKQYHFKNHYHPFVCAFIKQVYNPTLGIPALMSRETQLKENHDFNFTSRYEPTEHVFDYSWGRSYPQEVVDFCPNGSYSPYNWELFYHIPLMIANSLSKDQRFEEAMTWYHFIFNPIGVEGTFPDGSDAPSPQKFWITKPFFLKTSEKYQKERIDTILRMIAGDTPAGESGETSENTSSCELKTDLAAQVKDWRYHPFEPHRIAQYRNVAYQKAVFMKYLDNLIAWGDQLFRQDSMESINEASQLYVLAAELLGPRPQTIPPQAVPPMKTFNELEDDFDDFSNALLEVENYIPVMHTDGNLDSEETSTLSTSPPIPTLYFCIPQNDKILSYWDIIADRLYKIRNCMNIEGVVRQLSLFEPEIDPGALVKSIAGGMDINSALADLNAPLPYYRFNVLLQKANEVCNDVKSFGSALLIALEKKDAEELSLLRQTQELRILERVKEIREQQLDESRENLEGLKKSKEIANERFIYYETIEKINEGEQNSLDQLKRAHNHQEKAQQHNITASLLGYLPNVTIGGSGFGGSPHVNVQWGTGNIISALQAIAGSENQLSSKASNRAGRASTMAGHERRFNDWKLQERLAAKELEQIDFQIAAAEIRITIAEKEIANQELQIENSKQVDAFMKSKYTNRELYQWMAGQISQMYFQSYQLAYDLAKRAERCYRFELGLQESDFIKFGYWDSLKKGLLSGEKLQYDLRKLETSYLEQNRRELELTKHISLALLDPMALIKLKETGKCFFNLPEELFDLDYPGHYFRRIKSVSISLPCIAGPYTTIPCSLRLLKNRIRVQTGIADSYEHNNEDGVLVNDPRFVQNNIPIKAMATSNAQNDSGIFELNFRDERYLPFEGAGVISDWTIDLFNDSNPEATDFGKSLRQFDYNTISDVIVHVRYTAREAGGLLKDGAISNLKDHYGNDDTNPGMKIINLKHDFASEWHKLLYPDNPDDGNILKFEIMQNLFSYKDSLHTLKINSITFLAKCSNNNNYEMTLNPPLPTPPPAGSDKMSLIPGTTYGNLHFSTKDTTADAIELDFSNEIIWNLKIESQSGTNLAENELQEMYLILGYNWGN